MKIHTFLQKLLRLRYSRTGDTIRVYFRTLVGNWLVFSTLRDTPVHGNSSFGKC